MTGCSIAQDIYARKIAGECCIGLNIPFQNLECKQCLTTANITFCFTLYLKSIGVIFGYNKNYNFGLNISNVLLKCY